MSDTPSESKTWSMREMAVVVGLAVALVGLAGTVVGGGMWLGRIDERVQVLTKSTVTDGRIATLEAEVRNLTSNTKDLQRDVRDLLVELKRNR